MPTPPSEKSDGLNHQVLASFDFVVEIATRSRDVDLSIKLYSESREARRVLEEYLWEQQSSWRSEILQDIDERLRFKYGNLVYAQIPGLRRGSIIGTIVILLIGSIPIYDFLSKYKDFHESISLLREQITSIITRITRSMLEREGGYSQSLANIIVDVRVASVSSPHTADLSLNVDGDALRRRQTNLIIQVTEEDGHNSFVIRCAFCWGVGRMPTRMTTRRPDECQIGEWHYTRKCPVCDGKGLLRVEANDLLIRDLRCRGTGHEPWGPSVRAREDKVFIPARLGLKRCSTCNGIGVRSITGYLKVRR